MPDALAQHLTAKALVLAFRGSDGSTSATALAATAGQNRTALERARARLRRGVAERHSPVGERAVEALTEALRLLDGGGADRPVVGY